MRYLTAPRWFRMIFPAPLTHIPSEQEIEERSDELAREVVRQHAEGSVLLADGKFELSGDLFAEEEDSQGASKPLNSISP